jgi:hypothetical protein
MKTLLYIRLLLVFLIFTVCSAEAGSQVIVRQNPDAEKRLKKWKNPLTEWQHIGKPKIDSVKTSKSRDHVQVYFSPVLSYYPFREGNLPVFNQSIKKELGRKYRKSDIKVYTNGYPLEQLVPNIYRKTIPLDSSRLRVISRERPVLVKRINFEYPSEGLSSNSIALWHSHGFFYEMTLDRWEFQRARLFGTVEDISVMGYVLPYLSRMLENAGANVFIPRERDVQTHEVIVDNDKSTGNSEVVIHPLNPVMKIQSGFLFADTLFPGVNPFRKGTSLRLQSDSALYIPDIPADGDYAVYISYPRFDDNSSGVKYYVNHSGGSTGFIVNQTIGGETWIYLGTFRFLKGKNERTGSVSIKTDKNDNGYISLDAIKFGGGMGNVARRPSSEIIGNLRSVNENGPKTLVSDSLNSTKFGWKISGKPRFVEGSRYYLQYAGMPDTLVYSPNNNKNDYNDDYQSRGYWVNYLMGKTSGRNDPKQPDGLRIPVDISMAFHTDAGITPNDSIIGSLAIYSTGADNGKFPDSTSRLASRDYSDMVQTQVVSDLRKEYDKSWTRRGIWDRPYAEARRPDVPALLLELLSHQNQADQKFGLDPRFRFAVSRAIYKGILKYLSYNENRPYVVQPLPVTDFAITPVDGRKVRLSWKPVIDSLESTSKPDSYKVYKRVGENGFDNGFSVRDSFAEIELDSYNTIYSYKVTAINAGGESFESEVLSVGIRQEPSKTVLVVNGFDRISGPEWFDVKNMAGVAWWTDRGVADRREISFTGDQYDFDRKSEWLDDDAPGWGASYGDMEGKVIPGNTFDYTYLHGKSIMNAGYSFCSVSGKYFTSPEMKNQFGIVDLILGEEKSTTFFKDTSRIDYKIYTPEMMKKLDEITSKGTNVFISGAYIGTDTYPAKDSTAFKFVSNTLHFKPRTGHAVRNGNVYAADYARPFFTGKLNFNTGYSESIYSVESPDAIEPSGKGAITGFRYSENNTSAGVLYKGRYGIVAIGFPFETIINEEQRLVLMKQILNFFENK